MTVTWQTIITLAAILSAIFAILKYYNKGYDWVKRQNEQDEEIKAIKREQRIITKGLLACLQGLSEKGCDGPVTASITEIQDFLNENAHK